MQVVNNRSPSGDPVVLKDRIVVPTGAIPTPFTSTASGDGVAASPAQALPASVFLGSLQAGEGVITLTYGTAGRTTVTPGSITLDVYVTKGGASA